MTGYRAFGHIPWLRLRPPEQATRLQPTPYNRIRSESIPMFCKTYSAMHAKLKSFAGAGCLALLAVGLTPLAGQVAPAPAIQPGNDNETVKLNTFVVTGLRGSLASAEEIKESSQEIVDSIVPTDIDKLPDINVSYALARIPDVQLAHTFSGLGGNGAASNAIVISTGGVEPATGQTFAQIAAQSRSRVL